MSSRIRDPILIYKVFWIIKIVESISKDSTFNFSISPICTREEPKTGKPIYFNPDVEDEVITDLVSNKLDRSLVNPPNKVWGE